MENYNDILDVFFSRTFENTINERMFYRDYYFPQEEIIAYINNLISIDLVDYCSYIRNNLTVPFIDYCDIFQFSSFENATSNITSLIAKEGDNGLTFAELGQLLLKDGIDRNDIAYRKYGENHTKTAREFGLTQILYNKTFLSCIGRVLYLLPEEKRICLLRRLILRNKYIKLLVKISFKETISLDSQMGLLSESTRQRRLSNMRSIWRFILAEDESVKKCLHNIKI